MGHQAHKCGHALRVPTKPLGRIQGGSKRQRDDWPDTWCRHQPTHHRILLSANLRGGIEISQRDRQLME